MSSLSDLGFRGQSLWLDSSQREVIQNGVLRRLIAEDALKGVFLSVRSFERAVKEGTQFDATLNGLLAGEPIALSALVRGLYIAQARDVSDLLSPVHEATHGIDGHVCVPASPLVSGPLAVGARDLWKEIGRRNCMLSLPASAE
jgi:hypothetical protein